MKKYAFWLAAFFGLFLLSGCGGGSDNVPNSGTVPETGGNPAVNIQTGEMLIKDDTFTIRMVFVKKIDSSYQVELSKFNLATDTCTLKQQPLFTPDVLHMNGGMDSTAVLNISGTFDANCTGTGYTFSANQKTTKDGKVDTRMFSVTYDANNPGDGVTPVPSSGFFNATTPLEVTQAGTGYEIKVQMIEDGYVASGKVVKLLPFDKRFGSAANYEATSGEDGYAVFQYTSPETLPADGTSTVLQLTHNENGALLTQNIVLTFENKGSLDKVDTLYLVPNQVTITSPGEEKEITILTLNAQHIGVSSSVVLEQLSDGIHDYGSFEPSGTITTDESGKAVVTYIAPDSISGISERNITVTETSQNLTQTLNIQYNTSTGPGIDYEIEVSVPESLDIEDTDQITVTIHELGNPSVPIADSKVHEVNLTTMAANILTFGGKTTESYMNAAVKPVAVTTKTLSGTAVIEINALVDNGEKDVLLSATVPVVVLSGPVTAMSLFYAGTSEDTALGIYKNTYTIHAVDKYDNPAREGITLHPSIINGTKVIRSVGTSGQITQGAPGVDTFNDGSLNIFASVDTDDILSIVPNANRFSKNYIGNWSIDFVSSPNQLELAEDYLAATTNGLSYVIGNSKRYLPGYGVAAVDIKDKDGKGYVTDKKGNVQFNVTFDPVLAGHTVTLSANAYDGGERTGVAKIAGLRWDKYSSTVVKIPNDGNEHIINLTLGISNGVEALIDVDIVPSSIVSNDATCDLNTSTIGTTTDLHTDMNGEITVQISTGLSSSPATECEIKWSATQAGIYREY